MSRWRGKKKEEGGERRAWGRKKGESEQRLERTEGLMKDGKMLQTWKVFFGGGGALVEITDLQLN